MELNNLYTEKQLKVLNRALSKDFFLLIQHGAKRAGKTITNNDLFLLELKSGSFNLKELSNDSFEKLDKVLNSLDETLIQAEKLINNIEQSPSDLLFKQKSIKYGPGEIDEK